MRERVSMYSALLTEARIGRVETIVLMFGAAPVVLTERCYRRLLQCHRNKVMAPHYCIVYQTCIFQA